jgi:hypothetical protein
VRENSAWQAQNRPHKPKVRLGLRVRGNNPSRSQGGHMAGESYTGEAYCVKCKAKREFTGEVHETNGRRMAKGICPTCGTKVTRILGKA